MPRLMKTKESVFLILVLFTILSCGSGESKSEETKDLGKETYMYVRFMEKERNVKASAEFKILGENNQKSPDTVPYKIWFQGRTMENLQEYTGKNLHNLELEYALPGVFEFTVEDETGNTENFSFDLNSRETPQVISFSRQEGLKINLGNIKLNERDALVVVATDQMSASASSIVNGPGSGTLIFTPTAFEQLKPGLVDLYLVLKGSDIDTLKTGRAIIKEREYFFKEITADLQ
jgi:hypothetical protein